MTTDQEIVEAALGFIERSSSVCDDGRGESYVIYPPKEGAMVCYDSSELLGVGINEDFIGMGARIPLPTGYMNTLRAACSRKRDLQKKDRILKDRGTLLQRLKGLTDDRNPAGLHEIYLGPDGRPK